MSSHFPLTLVKLVLASQGLLPVLLTVLNVITQLVVSTFITSAVVLFATLYTAHSSGRLVGVTVGRNLQKYVSSTITYILIFHTVEAKFLYQIFNFSNAFLELNLSQ